MFFFYLRPVDLYHTCYTLSGLAIAQHCCEYSDGPVVVGNYENEVLPTHPLHNIPPKSVINAFEFFQNFHAIIDKDSESAFENENEVVNT